MCYLRSGTYRSPLIVGSFVTLFVLALLVHVFASDQMTAKEALIVRVAIPVLALAAGREYARRQVERREV